jgi:transposase
MGAAHSDDLRERVVWGVLEGMSRREAATHFRVSASSAIRWMELKSETGGISPRRRGGKSRSPLEPHEDWLVSLVSAEPDLTLEAMVLRIGAELGLKTSDASLCRFFKRHRISFKKNPARGRAGPAGRGRRPRGLESRPGGS